MTLHDWTPYIIFFLGVIGGIITLLLGLIRWVFLKVNQRLEELSRTQDRMRGEIIELRTAFRFYLESQGKRVPVQFERQEDDPV